MMKPALGGRAEGQRNTVGREECLKHKGVAQHNANRAAHEFKVSVILVHMALPREPNTHVSPREAANPNAAYGTNRTSRDVRSAVG